MYSGILTPILLFTMLYMVVTCAILHLISSDPFTAMCTSDLWPVFCAYCLLMWSPVEINKLIFTWRKKEKLHRKNNVNDKVFHCFLQKIENKIIRDNHNSYYVHCKSRLYLVRLILTGSWTGITLLQPAHEHFISADSPSFPKTSCLLQTTGIHFSHYHVN